MRIKKFKDITDKYLYDSPFYNGVVYYVCTECYSNKLVRTIKGGFQPPEYICDNCGSKVYSPMSLTPDKYKEFITEKELKKDLKKFNM